MWIHDGRVRAQGPTASVIEKYRAAMHVETVARTPESASSGTDGLALGRNRFGSQEATLENVRMLGPDGIPTWRVRTGDSISIQFSLQLHADLLPPVITLTVLRRSDMPVRWDLSNEHDGAPLPLGHRTTDIHLDVHRLDLLPGDYLLEIGAYPDDWSYAYDFHSQAYPFHHRGSYPQTSGVSAPVRSWSLRAAVEADAQDGPARS